MKINRGREAGLPSEQRTETFTGEVWADPVLPSMDGVMVNNVFFAPGSRTHWHRHGAGQLLVVTSGEGRVGLRDGTVEPIGVGDTVWFPPGEEHWHGAASSTYLMHLAVSLESTEWLEPVSDADYERSDT
jgi:quercetin dioxygenase-like cupin family protein